MPQVKGAPEGFNSLLEKVYGSCMKGQADTPANKTSCSKVAYSAARKAGWFKKDGNWTKTKSKRK